MDSSKKVLNRVKILSESLDGLDGSLEQLFSQSLAETLVSLDTLQQAKLQVVLPYLINDLIFIYLKLKGIDPKTHPVIAELDRVRQYFDKIKNAEGSEKRRTELDKDAANRFIKHAISQLQENSSNDKNVDEKTNVEVSQNEDSASTKQVPALERLPAKMTSKMMEREKHLQELREMSSDDEDEILEVFDSDPVEVKVSEEKGKMVYGQQNNTEADSTSSKKRRRRKRVIDPFAASGVVDDNDKTPEILEADDDGLPKKKSQKSNANSSTGLRGNYGNYENSSTSVVDSANTSVVEADDSLNSNDNQKKSKKRRKKKFKLAKGLGEADS